MHTPHRRAGARTRRVVAPLVLVIAVTAGGGARDSASSSVTDWLQWGGPTRDFIVETTGLADTWPEGGPPEIWRRPLGLGHSAILVEDGRLYTMYRAGNPQGRDGPWDKEETVVALDAATGETLWAHTYPSAIENFRFGAGPHATPLIVGDRLFATGTNKQLHALDKGTGKVLWSHDLDGILFVSSAYDAGSRGLRLTRESGTTRVEELWFTVRMRLMFTNGIRIGHHVYGTDAAFGPAFVTAIDVRTGEIAWRERGFARANLIHAAGRFIILDEDGDLALATMSPEGLTLHARTSLFGTTAWTVPTLAGTTLYARDREQMVAIDLGAR